MKNKLRQFLLKDGETGQTMHVERGLANGGFGQLVCWTLERGFRKLQKPRISSACLKRSAASRELRGQILAHADGLSALAGKQ